MSIQNIWACTCGASTPCEEEDTKVGAVWNCPSCEKVFGRVRSRSGTSAWVTISPREVKFYRLLGDQ
jgi:hypothetical protein